MSASQRSAQGLFSEAAAGPLPLMIYLLLAVALMVADHRGGVLNKLRVAATVLVEPLYVAAGLPSRFAIAARERLADQASLRDENRALAERLLIAQARLDRLQAIQQENQRLRDLLGGTRGLQLSVQLATVLDVDLDPFRHRILIDAGAQRGAREGLALIDAGGVVGQVLEVRPFNSTALLVSDPSHAVPVQVLRTGVRTIAYGTGRTDTLVMPNIPQSADIAVGDQIVTSGIGGRFPAGLAVGEITSVASDDTRLFLIAEARPAAALDRSGELLLLWTTELPPEVGPPAALAPPEQQP